MSSIFINLIRVKKMDYSRRKKYNKQKSMVALRRAIRLITFDAIMNHFKTKVHPRAVYYWKERGVPIKHAEELEKLVGGRISKYEFAPELLKKEKDVLKGTKKS